MKGLKGKVAGLEFDPVYLISDSNRNVLEMRYRTSSDSRARAIGQNCGLTDVTVGTGSLDRYHTKNSGRFASFIGKENAGYSTIYEGVALSERVDTCFLFTTVNYAYEDYYNYLMQKFHLPLLREWSEYLYLESKRQGCLKETANRYSVKVSADKNKADYTLQHGDRKIPLTELIVVDVGGVSDSLLRIMVENGLKQNKISLAGGQRMEKLGVNGMDEYTIKFGPSLCENLEKEKIRPKSRTLQKSVEGLALLNRKLYPPQAAAVNGIVASMFSGDNYIFVSEEMGCGKTIQAAAAVEAYFNRKWMNVHPGKTLRDCFISKEAVYRVAVVCPSHLCEKWKAEVESQIPGARGILVTDLAQLEALRNAPKTREGKEFFIFSKEFAKGDTYKRPVPTKIMSKVPIANLCYDCVEASVDASNPYHRDLLTQKTPWRKEQLMGGCIQKSPMYITDGVPTCIWCGGHRPHAYELEYPHEITVFDENGKATDSVMSNKYKGLCCPECDNLLIQTTGAVYLGDVEDFGKYVLTPASFANKTKGNECCTVCGCSLWEDNVQAMNIPLHGTPTPVEDDVEIIVNELGFPEVIKKSSRKREWVKIKFCGDYGKQKLVEQKKRLNKSAYALRGYELETVSARGVGSEFVYAEREYGPRRFSPARFAKRYLRGYFDVLIADEAHLYEGCRTEQAMAVHALMKTAKYSMLLTGTLTNGTASSLFNIHFMVNPRKMRELGYRYTSDSARAFAEKYGVVETKFKLDCDEYGNYNAQGRGQQLGSPAIKPGISPMIYPDLLLNHTVQLNIADMSNCLPPLNEYVVEVDMNEEQTSGYNANIEAIKYALDNPPMGTGLLGKMLQLGLSYPDKPYGRSDVWSLKLKDTLVVSPMDLSIYSNPKCLLPKEKELVDIVNKEIAEGRNLFIFTEYSGNEETDIDGRLQEIVETHCNLEGQVKVLKSGAVKAADREMYIKKNSDKYKVWITNYRNVETGIDFVGEYKGRKFNYPTIIFFQIGMSLSAVWQASRRHYRIIQTEECRTYYLVSRNTFQLDMLEMMSRKMSAASAIQGNFSESALENMTGSDDPAVVLAKKIMAGQRSSSVDGASLEAQFAQTRNNAIKACDESIYVGEEPVTYYEVMGNAQEKIFDFAADIADAVTETIGEIEEVSGTASITTKEELFAEFNVFEIMHAVTVEEADAAKKKSDKPMIGQLTFF